jgi:hypothetical protein
MRHLVLLLLFLDLQNAINSISSDTLEFGGWVYPGIDTAAHDATFKALKQSKKADDVARSVAKALSITDAAARPLIEAILNDPERKVATEALFREALRQAPNSGEVLGAYLLFLARKDSDDAFAAAALPVARRLHADQIARLSEMMPEERRIILIADALASDPNNRVLLDVLVKPRSPAIRAALIDRRWGNDAVAMQLAALLDLGRVNEALALADAVPAAIDVTSDGGYTARPGLAIAAVLAGQPERAKKLIAKYKTPNNGADYVTPFVNALIAPPRDAYEILAAHAGASDGVCGLAVADLAQRSGYDAFAQRVRARTPSEDRIAANALRYLPESLAARLRTMFVPPSVEQSAATPIAALLRAPRIVPFAEHPMPSSLAPVDVTQIDCHDAEQVAKSMKLPPRLWPLRLERHRDEVAGVAVAQTLDPVGELGLGGYWIVHSSDGGRKWDAPLYTGLRENMPYVVVPASRLPLITNGGIQIEVELRELDLSSITFPPVGLRTKREAKNLYIEFAWDALRRDSDNDGLTDLIEERIVTDPRNADTDGDGIIDGKDGLPQVALIAAPSADAEVLGTLFGGIRLGLGALVVGLPSTQEQRLECVVRASAIDTPTLFLITERQTFAPMNITRRVAVFTAEEHGLYEKKFGPSYFGEIDYFLVRRDGKKAVVYVNEHWAGNEYELKKTKKGWTVKTIGGWIT